jgi:AcrR family transcriptional regulator
MNPEETARNQRARLCGAMIESVARRGYQATTVGQVLALAGVSRRAFYEQFPNKEHCFLATHDILVARERKRVIESWQGERGWSSRLHTACATLLEDVATDTKGASLVLVDSLGLGASARERMLLVGITFERLLTTAFDLAPDGREPPAFASRAIVGGVRHVLHTRLLGGRAGEIPTLTAEVLDWIDAHRFPAGWRPPALGPRAALEEAPRQPAFVEGEGKRARALSSLLCLTLMDGYASLSDRQIAQFGRISTEAFHRQFADKEACFIALLDELTREAVRSASAALEAASSWPQGVERTMTAFVEYLLDHRELLRIAFVDIFEVGSAIVGRLAMLVEAIVELLTQAGPEPRRAPMLVHDALTGAIWAVIAGSVAGGRLSRPPRLRDQLVFVVLTPYIGAKGALEAIQAASQSVDTA